MVAPAALVGPSAAMAGIVGLAASEEVAAAPE
jgi:hypothetical protein